MTTFINENKANRFLEIDYLRGLAALGVVLAHFTYGYDNGLHLLSPYTFYFRYGNLGVQLFFVISGFVIFMTLEKTKDSLDFLISRFSRLYPTYWGAIVITLIFDAIFLSPFNFDKFTLKQVLINITMLQHWFKVKDINGAYWTLGIELTFYFLMWILFYFKKLKYIEFFCLGWLVLSFLNLVVAIPVKNILQQVFILQHAPMFVAGIVFYNVKTKNGYTILRGFLHLFGIAIESIILYQDTYIVYKSPNFIIPISIVCAIYLFFYFITKNILVVKANKVMLFLSTISYSLYLIHVNIGFTLIYHLKKIVDIPILYLPITIIIVTGLAYLLTVFIEKPLMKLIRDSYKKWNEKKIVYKAETQFNNY
jgi:peptidoglycan/LPS O-acetylase OafA/YrhL